MTLHVSDDKVTFNIFEVMKYLMDNEDCFRDIVDKLTMKIFREEYPTLPLEACIIHSDANTKGDHAKRECMNYLEATTIFSKKEDFMELKYLPSTLMPSI